MTLRIAWKRGAGALTFSFAWVYLVSTVAALAGLFLPFARQDYGCPPDTGCLLFAGVAQPSLVQGRIGPALLGLVSAALLLGLLSLARPGRLLFLFGLPLSLATLALVSLDAATAGYWLWGLQDPLPVSFQAGLYLTAIGSATASFMGLMLLIGGAAQLRRRHATPFTLGFGWGYVVSTAASVAGLVLPFVQSGCTVGSQCPYQPEESLAQGQDGAVLLALALAALLVGGGALIRLSTPMLVAQLVIPLAMLAFISLDAVDPVGRVLQWPPDSWILAPAPGLYLAVVASSAAALTALALLFMGLSPPRRARGIAVTSAAA